MLTVCRCCLATGVHKDLKQTYFWSTDGVNKKEIYFDMLKECFGIMLSSECKSNGICDACIGSLRRSCNFKQQILRAEKELLAGVNAKGLMHQLELKSEPEDVDTPTEDVVHWEDDIDLDDDKKPFSIKQEVLHESDNASNDFVLLVDQVQDVPSREIKKEKESPTKCQKDKSPKGTRPKSTIKKQSNPDVTWRMKLRSPATKTAVKNSIDVATTKTNKDVKVIQVIPKLNNTKKIQTTIPPISKINLTWTNKLAEKVKQHDNLKIILKYSNAILFKNKTILGIICGHCEATFPDPKELKEHTFKVHEKERLDYKPTDNIVNIDVGNLICNLCNSEMSNLSVLKEHLVKVHNKTIHNEVKDYLVQFKLKKEEVYDCVMCTATYETFKMLKQHMNQHYGNYACNLCESAFITRRSLNSHIRRHEKGSFKCEHCEKVFSTMVKKTYHVKMKHLRERNISNCPYCDEPFRTYYQRNQHLIKVHNIEAQYKCKICNRAFILKSILMNHIKKVHLMERNCQCSECGYRFFSKKALKAHMVKHTGEKNYTCRMCNKSYARNCTLREHMRIHNNDRRFKCKVCELTFVQKCSLKSHLLTNHGIKMAANEITTIK